MAYYEFTIANAGNSREALLNRMSELGCLGASENGEKIVAYFSDTHNIVALRDSLRSFRMVLRESGLSADFTFDYLYLSERDWNESWKKRFVPIDVGKELSVLPPWENAPEGRTPVIIDPGMAFGTGHHETTKTCLMLIERFAVLTPPPTAPPLKTRGGWGSYDAGGITPPSPPLNVKGRLVGLNSFLDVGTGTGILAIAAARLGFRHVTGVDIDPLAVDAAKRNAELNHLRNVEIRGGSLEGIEGVFDMVVANLMSDILIRIAPEIASRLNTPGIAILSGMLVGQEMDVIAAMEAAGLSLIDRAVDGRWISLVLISPL